MSSDHAEQRARPPDRRFSLLGSVELRHDGREIRLGGKGLAILAGLLLKANQPVSAAELMRIVWDDPANGSRTALHALISRLRQTLGDRVFVRTVESGYLVEVAAGELDLRDFHAEVELADQAALIGDSLAERGHLSAALALWRGPALAGVPSERLRQEHVARLDEQRLWVLSRRIDLDIEAGQSAAVIGELRALAAEHPAGEGFAAQLMTALYGCGRRAEALDVYRSLRSVLVEQVGIEPGAAVTRLHREILAGEPDRVPAATRSNGGLPASRAEHPVGPLPIAPERMIGRDSEIRELVDWLSLRPEGAVAVVSGLPGVGKSAVAIEVAHRLRRHYPDGQWYFRLGDGPGHEQPGDALAGLLLASGVRRELLPPKTPDRAEVLRRRVAGRRILLVLDDVADAARVVRALPESPGCAVLVVSRAPGTEVPDALWLRLKPLANAAACELLEPALGAERMAAEPDGAYQLARVCEGLPLALDVLRERLLRRPAESPSALGGLLRDPRTCLGELKVRSAFAARVSTLDSPTRLAFRRMGLLPPGEFGAWSLGLLSDGDGRWLTRRLAEAGLVEPVGPDEEGEPRYRAHGLVALYARELAEAEPGEVTRQAVRRLMNRLLAVGEAVRRSKETTPIRPQVDGITGDPELWVHRNGVLFLHIVRQARVFGWKADVESLIDVLVTVPQRAVTDTPWEAGLPQ
ncbi:AfsR/SARP family transcriptional regulator [Amycolatopsis alba]|uniref:AfsR/SARP family transcriptional regulator n=1 Tax=Amycolatopsis alba TaxID=76020 RepID=UPI00036BC5A7|nr:AfsR/SARP family transcriptional regulator [Amycolatopsis alba]